METLVTSQHQHRNLYYSNNRAKPQGSYCSSPSKDFRVINCRTVQRGKGILPTPFKSYTYSSPVTKRASSPKTPSDNKTLCKTSTPKSTPIPINCKVCQKDTTLIEGLSDNRTLCKTSTPKSTPIPINCKVCQKDTTLIEGLSDNRTFCKTSTPKSTPITINGKTFKKDTTFGDGSLMLSELWAGPTYSNSPPPCSLPIPKFSVRPKRTVSLDLPGSSPEIEMHPIAKSAPSSPRRECSPCMEDLFVNADSATKTLCRILNLNLDDE